jgi:hypothetical protein
VVCIELTIAALTRGYGLRGSGCRVVPGSGVWWGRYRQSGDTVGRKLRVRSVSAASGAATVR